MNKSPNNISLLMKRKVRLTEKATQPELKIISLLQKSNKRFMFQKGFCNDNKFFIVDFYFPKPYKVCLEIDGKSHNYNKTYDNWRDDYLINKRNIKKVIRITNEQALQIKLDDLLKLCNLT